MVENQRCPDGECDTHHTLLEERAMQRKRFLSLTALSATSLLAAGALAFSPSVAAADPVIEGCSWNGNSMCPPELLGCTITGDIMNCQYYISYETIIYV